MPRITTLDSIMYLVERKYPGFRQKRTDEAIGGRRWPEPGSTLLGLGAGEAYLQELLKLSKEELDALVKKEQEAEAQEAEQSRFFNAERAAADFEHWSKAAYWTIDEAVALSLGKDPRVVNWKSMRPLTQVSKFAAEFQSRWGLAQRAVGVGLLGEGNIPGFFIAWAKRIDISFPQDLVEAVKARGQDIADWKTRFQQAMARIDELEKERDAMHVQRSRTSDEGPGKPHEKPLLTRERETVLKLILGMAMAGYGYDPNATRSSTAREIAHDLALLGLKLDEDTIRNWLKEARENFPREGQTGETE